MGAMKRSRSETHSIASGRVLRSSKRASISKETFPCPYVGCGQAFSSQISLKRHIPEHNGDKPIRCSVRGCQERFASLSEKQSHLQDAHNIQMLSQATLRKRKARDPQALNLSSHISDDVEDDAAKLNADDPSASGPAPKNDGASHQSDDSEESVGALETEASDIAANATYLASQMKIARSNDIAKWTAEDYKNAHRWALWVTESVEAFPNSHLDVLNKAVQQKGLSIGALRNAERAFFDSVVGYAGLTSDILTHLITSACSTGETEAPSESAEKSLDMLASAITAAMERKETVSILNDILADISSVVESSGSASDRLPNCARIARTQDVDAKAKIMYRRHSKLSDQQLCDHLIHLRGSLDDELLQLICHEAIIANETQENSAASSRSDVKRHLHDFILHQFESNPDEFVQYIDIEVVNSLCTNSCKLFDAYLCFLLTKHQNDARTVPPDGESLPLNFDNVCLRINTLTALKGPIGHMAKEIISQYCARTGTNLLGK